MCADGGFESVLIELAAGTILQRKAAAASGLVCKGVYVFIRALHQPGNIASIIASIPPPLFLQILSKSNAPSTHAYARFMLVLLLTHTFLSASLLGLCNMQIQPSFFVDMRACGAAFHNIDSPLFVFFLLLFSILTKNVSVFVFDDVLSNLASASPHAKTIQEKRDSSAAAPSIDSSS